MSICPLPAVQTPVIPKQRVAPTAVDLSNDYGTLNLAFFYHVRSGAGASASPWDAVTTWNAWELSIAEEHVHSQIDKNSLPSDDSIQSRMVRNAYRGKVIASVRELGESPWLLQTGSDTGETVEKSLKEDKVNAVIRETLRGFYASSEGIKNVVRINNIANEIASTPGASQRHVLSDVRFSSGGTAQDVNPDIRQCNFVVSQDKADKNNTVRLLFQWTDSWYKLDTAAWVEDSGRDSETKERIKAGLKIIQEMRLDVADVATKSS